MTNTSSNIISSAEFIKSKIPFPNIDVAIILGSGLGSFVDILEQKSFISYNEIPNFPKSTVEGHKGQFVFGVLEGKNIMVMQGRFHFYEGYNLHQVTLPVRVMALLAIKNLIVTNAAGAVNEQFMPGDLMLISDHINFSFKNPLIGKNLSSFGPRFIDTSHSYNENLQTLAIETANELNINLKKGIYQFSTGPSYETPAETKVARMLGADVVGMSTVPEVLTAVHCGMNVLGISCVTNMASGILNQPLHHDEVIETSNKVHQTFKNLIQKIIQKI